MALAWEIQVQVVMALFYAIAAMKKPLVKDIASQLTIAWSLWRPSSPLEALKEHCEVTLSTDSQYVRQGITQWIHNWKKRGWKTAEKKPVKNVDLWKRLDAALGQHQIKWEWVKGHAGHPENERCDELARAAAMNPTQEDVGYQAEA